MTISDDRLRSPQYLDGLGEEVDAGYALRATIPADGRMGFAQPFPFALDLNQINS
ncbi:hypothetical protein [Hamadaea tsunoensis]|uniref:hypothetical protein n=1 Tax=Hamadaea tsunoensis TaxID=53368 RepID=UPI00041D8ECC|nr:hypothetical protein [Hamadaea tsunoensis]